MADPSQPKLMGAAMLLASLVVALLITIHPEGLKAPAWVAYLAAGVFALGGATSLARAYRRPGLADALVCLLLGGMLVVELWVAIGPGARKCAGHVATVGVATSEIACRSAFGIGAFIVGGMLALAVRGWLRRRSAG